MILTLIVPIVALDGDEIASREVVLSEIMEIARNGWIEIGGSRVPIQAAHLNGGELAPEVVVFWKQRMLDGWPYDFFQFEVDLSGVAHLSIEVHGKDLDPVERPDVLSRAGADLLYGFVASILLASQIAVPGFLQMEAPLLYRDGDYSHRLDPISWILGESRESADELGWPPIRSLSVIQVHRWLIGIPGFTSGVGQGRVGRALAALSHIVCKPLSEYSAIDLSWAVLGLEALYAEGNQGLAQQILKKTEILLGPRRENKKRFSQMYDYRSRFLHGDLDIPLAYRKHQHDLPGGDFEIETYDCWGIACSMLVSTLQTLASAGEYELEFSYARTG